MLTPIYLSADSLKIYPATWQVAKPPTFPHLGGARPTMSLHEEENPHKAHEKPYGF